MIRGGTELSVLFKSQEPAIMMIHVEYSDGTFGKVERYSLQDLIVNKRIRSFLRSSGWVNVERDPVRRNRFPAQIPGHHIHQELASV